jgi:hypothetical protein
MCAYSHCASWQHGCDSAAAPAWCGSCGVSNLFHGVPVLWGMCTADDQQVHEVVHENVVRCCVVCEETPGGTVLLALRSVVGMPV